MKCKLLCRGGEGNILFNDTLNTFYLRLYGVIRMVKDHSDGERGNPLPPHGLLFRLAARVLLYASSHRQDNTTRAFVTPVVEHWLERELILWWVVVSSFCFHDLYTKGCGMCYPVCGKVVIENYSPCSLPSRSATGNIFTYIFSSCRRYTSRYNYTRGATNTHLNDIYKFSNKCTLKLH